MADLNSTIEGAVAEKMLDMNAELVGLLEGYRLAAEDAFRFYGVGRLWSAYQKHMEYLGDGKKEANDVLHQGGSTGASSSGEPTDQGSDSGTGSSGD